MQNHDDAPLTSLTLLAPDGIVHVAFARVLSGDEYLAILSASKAASGVENLQRRLLVLGEAWGTATNTKVLSRQKAVPRAQRV